MKLQSKGYLGKNAKVEKIKDYVTGKERRILSGITWFK
jgi:hypothetical protein